MTRPPPLTRAARLTSGVVLLLSFVLPMHGAGHALHGGDVGRGEAKVQPHGGQEEHREHRGHGTPGVEGTYRERGVEPGPRLQDHPGEGAEAGPREPGEDPHHGAPASCCTGPCLCPPVRSGPSPRTAVVRITMAPIRVVSWSPAAQAPPQPPIPHILPFSTAPPGPV